MKSLRTKLTLTILLVGIVVAVAASFIVLKKSDGVTKSVVDSLEQQQLTGGNQVFADYLKAEYGQFSQGDGGSLLDSEGVDIAGRYDTLDTFASDMGMVATIFGKKGSDFIRLQTNIKDDTGKRAEGTPLDTSGAAYKALMAGESFVGSATILGKSYMTRYDPMKSADGQIIGAYFTGTPTAEVNKIIEDGTSATLRAAVILILVLLILVCVVTFLISNSIVKPIRLVTDAAEQIAEGNFNVSLETRSRDEVGQLYQSFGKTVEQLNNYQNYIDEISDALKEISNGNLDITLKHEYVGQFKKLKDHLEDVLANLSNTLRQISAAASGVDTGAQQVASGAQGLAQGATE